MLYGSPASVYLLNDKARVYADDQTRIDTRADRRIFKIELLLQLWRRVYYTVRNVHRFWECLQRCSAARRLPSLNTR